MHNAGSWIAGNSRNGRIHKNWGIYADGKRLATMASVPFEEMENALLMGSAPDLLAACKRVLRAIEWSTASDRLSNDAVAAILKNAIDKATAS